MPAQKRIHRSLWVIKIPVWWRRAVLPSLPWVVFFLSFFLLYVVYLSMGVYFRVFARLWTENTLGPGTQGGSPGGVRGGGRSPARKILAITFHLPRS